MFLWLRYCIVIVLIAALIIFSIQNAEMIEVAFLGWTSAMPRALLIFFIFVAGAIVGWLFRGAGRVRV